jgi:signal transduction histidine kinase/CheY-like chemotaxis protein/CHASE3 domain sensor protein
MEAGARQALFRLRSAFWIGAGALVAVALTFVLLASVNHQWIRFVLESQQTARIASEARALAIDRETSIRDYLLTRKETSLAPDVAARLPLKTKLDSLVLLTSDNVSLQDRAIAIRTAVKRWDRGWAGPALTTPESSASLDTKNDLAGKELFDSIRSAFASFIAGEQRTFAARVRTLATLQHFTFGLILAELALLLATLLWLRKRALQQAGKLLKHQRELEYAETSLVTTRSDHEETQSLLEVLLANSPAGVTLFDGDRRIVRVNAAAAAGLMSGGAVEDHEGKRIGDLAAGDIAEGIDELLGTVLASGESMRNVPLSGTMPTGSGRERFFLCSFFPVKLPGGKPGAGVVVLETTQYRQLEEQLLQSRKMEAVGRLAGGVAHDFNNMLTAIMSYSELVLSEIGPESALRPDMMEIVKASAKAAALTRKLLAFSRQQVLRPELLDLNSTVGSVCEMMKRMLGKDVEVTCRLASELWSVSADQTEIERVVMNLALNSRDAMPDGGRLIIETSNVMIDEEYASTHADTAPGPYAMISVTDTGSGMTREVLDKVFEPFFTTKEKGKGTGLGLPSVYGIIRQSGGFVWVYSEPERGTTFKIYLPKSNTIAPISRQSPIQNRRVGPETILLVEDDLEVRQVAMRILKQNGYRVLEAGNGADALRICEDEGDDVDLIVTDIVMPEMGGSELAKKVRELKPEARILFTSGYTEDAVVRQSLLHAGEAFIEKPFTPGSLTKKTREILDSGGSEP